MKCISPITLKIQNPLNKDGKVIVPCGKCMNCLTNRRESWIIRLIEEFKTKKATFLTLTYNDENLVYADGEKPTLSKRDVQLFLKRLRKSLKKSIKYYCVGEYGTRTNRPHYHFILFNSSLMILIKYNSVGLQEISQSLISIFVGWYIQQSITLIGAIILLVLYRLSL